MTVAILAACPHDNALAGGSMSRSARIALYPAGFENGDKDTGKRGVIYL
ncbi:leucine-rich repeat protein [Moorella thermoacetica Y72]|uniref:Leucine-rich repeat protein n=1 Tax=Moorella thermoacetica Y72 TaxID=1325331 RepID=A0A0S6UGP8_NEOTH|nr:leucine-rich repeat protein [Moorella thermoacetica Y72]